MASLSRDGNWLFSSKGTCERVFQQDKDHTDPVAGLMIKACNLERCACVDLLQNQPVNSQDLHLIDTVWSRVQNEVNKKACRTSAEFEVEVQNVLRSIPRTMLDNLWKIILKRKGQVVEMDGKRVKYQNTPVADPCPLPVRFQRYPTFLNLLEYHVRARA